MQREYRIFLLSAVLALGACGQPSSEPAAQAPTAQVTMETGLDASAYAERGRTAANPDFQGLAPLCGEPSNLLTPAMVGSRPWSMPDAVPPMQIFDNLYFVGNAATSAWVIKTSDGLILLDALWHPKEAEENIEGGLRELGLSPEDIKIMVLSHGHGDHTGGARYLYDKYQMQVVMSKIDWDFVNDPNSGFDFPGWNDIPQPDILITDSQSVTLGDTAITIALAPGHTPGTLSVVFDVQTGGEPHRAVLWGGTGFNFGPKIDQYQSYAASAENMRRQVLDQNIEIFLSNHVRRDGSDKKMEALASRKESDLHPFILGADRASKAFEVFRDCALSQAAKLETTTPKSK